VTVNRIIRMEHKSHFQNFSELFI